MVSLLRFFFPGACMNRKKCVTPVAYIFDFFLQLYLLTWRAGEPLTLNTERHVQFPNEHITQFRFRTLVAMNSRIASSSGLNIGGRWYGHDQEIMVDPFFV